MNKEVKEKTKKSRDEIKKSKKLKNPQIKICSRGHEYTKTLGITKKERGLMCENNFKLFSKMFN